MKLRQEVKEYALEIVERLGNTVGVIASWGLTVPRSTYLSATLRQYVPEESVRWDETKVDQSVPSRFISQRQQAPMPPLVENELLREWLGDDARRSLLIVAPPGAGKSALLESFALRMARDLIDNNDGSAHPSPAPCVPLVVPIASAMAARSLKDFIFGRQNRAKALFGGLSTGSLQLLAAERRLILFVDGFDEDPPARERLTRDLNLLKIPFVLTSRPGYGAESVIDDPRRHLTIAELTSAQCRRYVEAYFADKDIDGDETIRSRLASLEESSSKPLDCWLTRPLYLKTWCEYVDDDPRHRAPESLASLAGRLLRGFTGRSGILNGLRKSDSEDAIAEDEAIDLFSAWIGRLGYYFAQRGFGGQRFADSEGRAVLESTKPHALLTATIKSGLLMKINDCYYLPKIPIVEYCTGRLLANDATSHPNAPVLLIETFRRWIWRPNLHDILDYTFDILWNALSTSESHWAFELLAWAINADAGASSTSVSSEQSGDRDCMRPFSSAALRWHALNSHYTEEHASEIRRAAGRLAENWLAQEAAYRDQQRMLPNGFLPYAMVLSMLEEFGGVKGGHSERGWEICAPAIEAISHSIKQRDAVQLVEETIRRLAHCSEQDYMVNIWSRASEFAARRVGQEDTAATCHRWIDCARKPASIDSRAAWLTSANKCAEDMLSPEDAPGVLHEALAADVNQDDLEFSWISLAATAASHMPYKEIAQTIERVMFKLRAAEAGDAKEMWSVVIRAAAGGLPPHEARSAIEKWFAAYRRAKTSDQRMAYLAAANGAALRLRAADAAFIIGEAVALLADTEDGPNQWDLLMIIHDASYRVCEDDSVRVLDFLLRQNSSDFDYGIKGVASRIPPNVTTRVIRRCIDHHDDAMRQGHATRALQLVIAIESAASQLPREAAYELTSAFIDRYHLPSPSPGRSDFRLYLWLCAAAKAASRLKASEAASLAKKWVGAYKNAKSEEERQPIAEIIETVSTCLSQRDAVDVCEFFLGISMPRVALDVAIATNVTLASPSVPTLSGPYRAVKRVNVADGCLQLRLSLATAPSGIRKALLGPANLSLVQTKLLSALAQQWKMSRSSREENDAWLTWSPWAERAELTRQRIKPADQPKIIRPLLDHGLVESVVPGKKLPKYRITSDGLAFVQSQLAADRIA